MDLNSREFAPISNNYADKYLTADANQQARLTWPFIAGERPALHRESVSRAAFLASTLSIGLLLLAGGVFKLRHRSHRSYRRDRWHPASGWRGADFATPAESAGQGPIARERRGDFALGHPLGWRPPKPTDPARDLKASLQEFDLGRAGTASNPIRPFAPVAPAGLAVQQLLNKYGGRSARKKSNNQKSDWKTRCSVRQISALMSDETAPGAAGRAPP